MSHTILSSHTRLLSLEGRVHHCFLTPTILLNPLQILYSLLSKWISLCDKVQIYIYLCVICWRVPYLSFWCCANHKAILLVPVSISHVCSFKASREIFFFSFINWSPPPQFAFAWSFEMPMFGIFIVSEGSWNFNHDFHCKTTQRQKYNCCNSSTILFLISKKNFCFLKNQCFSFLE